jgi:methionyl-tRNA formyltransferase
VSVIVFVGAYAYAQQVLDGLLQPPMGYVTEDEGEPRWQRIEPPNAIRYPSVEAACMDLNPDLVVVAGWRKLVPILAPTVGFHSAKLPEYPGRAPVPNAILRGDRTLTNTMLWLDDDIDAGDIIDEWTFRIAPDSMDEVERGGRFLGPDEIYEIIGRTSAQMLRAHWQGLLDGTAPRRAQDPAKRGPLTPADAWQRL